MSILNRVLNSFTRLSIPEGQPQYIYQTVRYKKNVCRPIRGGGRPTPPGVIPPEPNKYKFRVIFPEDGKYTTKPLKLIKLAGRHPETGHVIVRTLGGGHKQKYRWVDNKHTAEEGKPLIEKIQFVRYDPVRSADIALAASRESSRWILASEHMKAGDFVTTSVEIPRIPIKPKEGDSYPLGALPIGTQVYNIEPVPGYGGIFARAAGTCGQLLRKAEGRCIVQLPSKEEISVSEKCMVTVGRVSNIDHGSIPIGSPNRLRWLGFRPCSGLWHRKDGYCGRKIKHPKPVKVFDENRVTKPEPFELGL